MSEKENLAIVDITSLLHSACYNCSVDTINSDNFTKYKETIDYYITNILDITKSHLYIFCIDKGKTFRHDLFPNYKGNRNHSYIKFFNDLYEYIYTKYNCVSIEGLEADDLLSIYARLFDFDYNVILCHKDKDLMQIPGNHFWYNYIQKNITIEEAFEFIDENKANKFLFKQLLIGDSTDNIKGLVSCGFASAEQYISDKSILFDCLNAYIYGIGKEEFNLKKSIKGNGKSIGVKLFYENYLQIKLLETFEEAEYFTKPIDEKFKTKEIINNINNIKTYTNGLSINNIPNF